MPGAAISSKAQFLNASLATAAQVASVATALEVLGRPGSTPADLPRYHAHVYNCPCLGGNITPHDAIVNCLAHAIHECGMTSVRPKAEVVVQQPGGAQWKADLEFVVDGTGEVITVDVSVVNTDSSSSNRRRGVLRLH